MKDEDRILLTFGWCFVMASIIVLICRTTYKLDRISRRLDNIEQSIIDMASMTDATVTDATITDATLLDATPTEPSDDEIVIEVRDEFKEDLQEVSEEIATPSQPDPEPERICMGCYELTAYIATGNPCADGAYPQVGYTVACNDSRLWHKWVEIEGFGTYYVHDTGGMASNVIDIFVGSYNEAIQFGRRSANVYIKN